MIRLPTHLQTAARLSLAIIVALLSLLLGGCQSLPMFSDAPEPLPVTQVLAEAPNSHEFNLSAEQNVVGNLARITSQENDTLSDIARHYGLGYNDITIANAHLDPWTLPANQSVLLPLSFIVPDAPRQGIVLNLANMRLFYYPKQQPNTVLTYPVGIGRQGWNTPLGTTQIMAKKANPDWVVPESIHREHLAQGDPLPKVIRSGPDNPLGYFAMPLGFNGYLIHGTNKPYGIGMQVSHGCVQLYPEDVEVLFKKVEVGTSVRIVHQPYLAGWQQHMLYLEAHEPLEKWKGQQKQLHKDIRKKLQQLAAEKQANVDWDRVEKVLLRADGVPTPVLIASADLPQLSTEAVEVAHPEHFYGQPTIEALNDSDWAILAASFKTETDAQKFAAMLNHQGPQIPARKMQKNEDYQVIAGPFKNKKEVQAASQRIKLNFDMEVTSIAPKNLSKN